MLWVKDKIDDVLENLNVKPDVGLSNDEVLERLDKYGLNVFEEEKKETIFQKILHHLLEIPTLILIAAAIIASIAAVMNAQSDYQYGTSASDWAKVLVILLIVVINVVLGLYQESKAEKA